MVGPVCKNEPIPQGKMHHFLMYYFMDYVKSAFQNYRTTTTPSVLPAPMFHAHTFLVVTYAFCFWLSNLIYSINNRFSARSYEQDIENLELPPLPTYRLPPPITIDQQFTIVLLGSVESNVLHLIKRYGNMAGMSED